MAKIIGQSDCTTFITQCLQRYGVKSVQNFNDIKTFHEHFSLILNDVKEKEQNKLDNSINELKLRETSLFNALDYKNRIKRTITNIKISKTKKKYGKIEKNYEKLLNLSVAYLYNARYFLEHNLEFYYGAVGEEAVIKELSTLPNTYYILNEIKIEFTKAIHWRKYNEYVRSAQIDHIVIGPSGIFLIETKNWKEMRINSIHNSPHKQVDRASLAFWFAQKRKLRLRKPYKTYNIVATLKDLPKFRYKFVDQLSINQLKQYILSKSKRLADVQIERLVNWVTSLRVINPVSGFWRGYRIMKGRRFFRF